MDEVQQIKTVQAPKLTVLILSCHLHLSHPSRLFTSGFPTSLLPNCKLVEGSDCGLIRDTVSIFVSWDSGWLHRTDRPAGNIFGLQTNVGT